MLMVYRIEIAYTYICFVYISHLLNDPEWIDDCFREGPRLGFRVKIVVRLTEWADAVIRIRGLDFDSLKYNDLTFN